MKMSEIEKFFPDYLQTGAFHQYLLKEYFHYHMLNVIYNCKYAKHLFLAGGTCLRIIHGFQRFSEDLDLDCSQYTKENHLNLSIIIGAKFQKLGIDVEIGPIREEKMRRLKAFQSAMNFPQLLQSLNFSVPFSLCGSGKEMISCP
jgi:predicted nucleotidyltransferase component of viral defense system